MPQFFYDFADDSVGSVPAGWARGGAWGAGQTTTVADVAGSTGGRAIVPDFTSGGSATGFLRCTDVGDTSAAVEIVARVRNVPTGAQGQIRAGVGVRFNDTGLNGYGFWRVGGFFGFVERTGTGDYSTFHGSGLSSTISDSQAWFWQRIRVGVSGANQFQAWVAADVDGQPGTWQGVIVSGGNTVTDSTRTTGFVGIHLWQFNELLTVDVVGIGTAGDAAPTTGAAPAFNLAQSGAIALGGTVAVLGDITAQGQFWRVPTNAADGANVHVTVFSGTSPTYSIRAQGAATVAGGYARIPASDGTPGDLAFAFVHNYTDNTATTNINGGPAIASRFTGA